MVIIVFAILLILGIAFYQTIQGCFGAMITAILTVLAAAVAFNYYEPLGALFADRLGAVADPAAMLVVFVIPLLVLRILSDRFIRGNVVLGLWPDRIGGAIFGFVTATIMTGMFMIIFQMLPMPASIIGWRTYDSALGVKDGGPPRWAAEFTLATAGRLSDGPLRAITSPKKFSVSHDDLLLESFCLRNRPTGARASTPTDAMKVLSAYIVQIPDKKDKRTDAERERLKRQIPKIQDATPPYPLLSWSEKEDTKVLAIRVSIDESARNEDDNWWRLPATHFRLVCESGRSFYPVGYLTYAAGWRVSTSISDKEITQPGDIRVARQWQSKGGPAKLLVDWLYRIPTGEKVSYVVFRRTAVAPMPPVIKGLPKAFDDDKDKHTQLALSIKPVYGRSALKPIETRRRPFTPEIVEVQERLPEGIWLRYKNEARPAPIKQIEITGGKLRSVLIDGAVSKLVPSKERGAMRVTGLYTSGRDKILVYVRCKIDREFKGASIIKNLRPRLQLNTGGEIQHNGAYIFYNVGGEKQVYFYYDSQASKDWINTDFAQAVRNNLADTETFGLIFSVPASESSSITGLTFFGAGRSYEFHTVEPLACSSRRR